MSIQTTTLPILRQENTLMIIQSAPEVYDRNSLSSQKCKEAGEALLARIELAGMNDSLDQECAAYIEKTKKTLKVMNERRSSFTKLFDQIRSEFTSMENAIDPSKVTSVPFLVQQSRNAYAAKKRAEEEAKRQEELRRQQREAALIKYRQEVEDDIRRQFDQLVNRDINFITSLNQGLTIENYTVTVMKIKAVSDTLPIDWAQSIASYAPNPYGFPASEIKEIVNRIFPNLRHQYKAEIGEYKDTVLDNLPSKYRELEKMAKADAEEKARLKAELEAKEAADLQRIEEERKKKEAEAQAAKEMQKQASEMSSLFDVAKIAAPASYQPKTSVKLRVSPINPQGVLDILGMWWSKEGQYLPVDELIKMFKKQISFVEKLANDKDSKELISSANVRYEEEVKAK
ncbi:MAG: hypothetical protein J1D77_03540 [Muribaculaceae bacterium]|nr:hypothetical protein [Muribaculaceae bacterium]